MWERNRTEGQRQQQTTTLNTSLESVWRRRWHSQRSEIRCTRRRTASHGVAATKLDTSDRATRSGPSFADGGSQTPIFTPGPAYWSSSSSSSPPAARICSKQVILICGSTARLAGARESFHPSCIPALGPADSLRDQELCEASTRRASMRRIGRGRHHHHRHFRRSRHRRRRRHLAAAANATAADVAPAPAHRPIPPLIYRSHLNNFIITDARLLFTLRPVVLRIRSPQKIPVLSQRRRRRSHRRRRNVDTHTSSLTSSWEITAGSSTTLQLQHCSIVPTVKLQCETTIALRSVILVKPTTLTRSLR